MSTQLEVSSDILLRLLNATEEIRNLLRQNSGKDDVSGSNRSSHDLELPAEAAQTASQDIPNSATLGEMNISETADDWPDVEKIVQYRERCANHRRACEKMIVELGYFIVHLRIVGRDLLISEWAENIREVLLDPVRCLEMVLNERQNVIGQMSAVKFSLWSLSNRVNDLSRNLRQKDAPPYSGNMIQWGEYLYNGYENTRHLVNSGRLDECLEFIFNVFFSDLEMAMHGVMEVLLITEETYTSEWLAAQKYEDFQQLCEEYINRVFPLEVSETFADIWLDADKVARYGKHLMAHNRSCIDLRKELEHLSAHYRIVGGDNAVVETSRLLQSSLPGPVKWLEQVLAAADGQRTAVGAAIVSFAELHSAINKFQRSLFRQKHAFYFRNVNKWMDSVRNGLPRLLVFLLHRNTVGCIDYIFDELLSSLNSSMVGVSTSLEKSKSAIVDSGNVAEELTTFRKESLPKFLSDQMERDTTRYVSLTTIATFFSSVTATTLQFTYSPLQAEASDSLRGAVNLFWFLSLVFSVSSGVSSLLGLTYRKSSIYDTCVPPKLIRLWLSKAPILFLIISAVSFIVGLNLFAYLSLQPHYVSLATSIFTGVHTMCLLGVTTWFIYRLKHDSSWAKRIGKLLDWIRSLRFWKLVRESWEWIRHPRQQYREKKMHLQRNFFWAFGIDNHVARINCHIDWLRDWPDPYVMSRVIRCIAYPMKMCWLETKNMFSSIGYSVRKHIRVSFHTNHAEADVESGERHEQQEDGVFEETTPESPAESDVESGERHEQEEDDVAEESTPESSVERAKNEFRKSLQRIFSKADWVDGIMAEIVDWEEGYDIAAERHIARKLWGYSDLVKRFHEELRPTLVEAREKRRREGEKDERRFQIMWQTFNGPYHSELEGQDREQTECVQSNSPVLLDDVLGPGIVTRTDAQPDNLAQPDDHPHPLDERAFELPTALGDTEALNPMYGNPIPQSNIEDGATSRNEVENITSTSMNNNERSRISQREYQ